MEYKECNIKEFEGLYNIYEDGTIYSVRKQNALKARLNKHTYSKYAYLYVTLTNKNKQKLCISIHRLVAHHWIQPIVNNNSKLEINHIDMNKTNNHYSNLELVTHRYNMQQARIIKPWTTGRKKGYKASDNTKDLIAAKKRKKVLVYNDTQELIFNSVEEWCTHFETYRKAFNRHVNSHKTYKGFYVRYL